ncbi:MAG: hypothetical protein JO033_21350 [Acidobacteriaceae bacterium]|nr:hypothetical protein [Acidobacteriota bacterium]MBV8811223.1 hypothetical protein [Acidobacteriaceae bacterium]
MKIRYPNLPRAATTSSFNRFYWKNGYVAERAQALTRNPDTRIEANTF